MNIIKNKNRILVGIMVIFVVILIITGIRFYNPTLTQNNDRYTYETEEVVDTAAPKVELRNRYIFTNDIEQTSLDSLFAESSELSKWSAKLLRFEKYGNLEILNEKALKDLINTIPLPCNSMELSVLGTDEVPTEDGIYRTVLEISDTYGNSTLEEIYVIYDTTGGRIDDAPDKTIFVEKENLDKAPEIDKKDYTIIDNVDGKIAAEDIQCELELRDAEKHEWLVHVSYTDRAGNNSKADFLIIVKEKQDTTSKNNDNTTILSENDNSNNQEVVNELHPSEEIIINAGYGVVVQIDTNTYSVLTHSDGCVNGKDGFDILDEYLATIGLYANNISGCWIDADNDWYRYIATNITELSTPNDDEFWD